MKLLIVIILFSFVLSGCSDLPAKLEIDRMTIGLEIIPEDQNGGYTISWNDTLGTAQGFDLEHRPNELHCVITNNENDTLGYYRGLSMPGQWTYFQTKPPTDSLINVKFMAGINHFSRMLAEQSEEYIDQFNENNKEPIEFKTIQLDLREVLRKKLEVELVNTKNVP